MRALAPALGFGFVLASALALVNLREIADAPTIDVAVPAAATQAGDGVVRGTIRDGVPPFELHWDGQPPSAVLVDATSGAVLAATAFSDNTFNQNRSAVRFVSGEVRFTLDARRLTPGTRLAVRCEAVRSRTRFYAWALLAIGLALAASALSAFRRPQSRVRLAGSAVFLALALATFTSAYPGMAVRVAENADEATLNSLAAVRDHPESFTLDKFLADPSNYAWYTPTYINAIRVFRHLGFHYQTSAAFFGLGAVLVYLFGLRRLFTAILGRDDYALAATLLFGFVYEQSAPPAGEYWSMIWLLPSTVFTAFVPWIVLLAMWALPTARRWWIPAVAAGLMVSIHPLSTLALAGAIMTALVVASDEPPAARVSGALVALAAMAVAMAPYVFTFLGHYGEHRTLDPSIAARALELIRASFAYLDPWLVVRQVLMFRLATLRLVLDAIAIVLLLRSRVDTCVRFYLGIAAGLAIVAFGIPFLDSAVASYLGRRQIAYELPRVVRYVDLLLVCGLAIGVRGWRGTRTAAVALATAGALCAVFAFGSGWMTTARMLAGRSRASWRILNARPDAETAAAQETIRAVQALRASNERVAGPQGLREFGIPLAWVRRDMVTMAYGLTPALVESADVLARAEPLEARPLTAESLGQLSSILEAQLFLVRRPRLDPALLNTPRVLFRNDVYAVVK